MFSEKFLSSFSLLVFPSPNFLPKSSFPAKTRLFISLSIIRLARFFFFSCSTEGLFVGFRLPFPTIFLPFLYRLLMFISLPFPLVFSFVASPPAVVYLYNVFFLHTEISLYSRKYIYSVLKHLLILVTSFLLKRRLFHMRNNYTCAILYLLDRKSTRLNSSHVAISYAVFCLKK